MGVVTFSLYALFFSIATRDERQTVFSLDTFSDAKFVIATGVSIVTLLLTTVFGPLEAFLKTTPPRRPSVADLPGRVLVHPGGHRDPQGGTAQQRGKYPESPW